MLEVNRGFFWREKEVLRKIKREVSDFERKKEERGRRRAEGKKACFFSLKGSKRKKSNSNHFSFQQKIQKNQARSKYDLLF